MFSAETDWKKLSTDDFSHRTFGQGSVGLRLKHFSQYAVLGKPVNTQVISLCIYFCKLTPVYVCNFEMHSVNEEPLSVEKVFSTFYS